MMHHRPPDALRFGVINRDDIGPGVIEVVWSNGDRSYGRGRWFPFKVAVRRIARSALSQLKDEGG
jgi:hypothetical protein